MNKTTTNENEAIFGIRPVLTIKFQIQEWFSGAHLNACESYVDGKLLVWTNGGSKVSMINCS